MSNWSNLFDNGVPNLSIFSIPITLFIAALPHWYTIYIAESNKVQGGWSNENPRAFVARLNAKAATGKKLNPIEELILRGQSAQQNGFEWFPVWAVAVVSFWDNRAILYLLMFLFADQVFSFCFFFLLLSRFLATWPNCQKRRSTT